MSGVVILHLIIDNSHIAAENFHRKHLRRKIALFPLPIPAVVHADSRYAPWNAPIQSLCFDHRSDLTAIAGKEFRQFMRIGTEDEGEAVQIKLREGSAAYLDKVLRLLAAALTGGASTQHANHEEL